MRVLTVMAGGSLVLLGCGGGDDSGNFGQAAAKSEATRVIEVQQLDAPRYEPAFISVKPSETVTLRITNKGTRIHEFFLGEEKAQDEREALMTQMGQAPMNMADSANSVTIDPGATEEITWNFPKTGDVPFGCHQPGDYGKGMKGTVRVSP